MYILRDHTIFAVFETLQPASDSSQYSRSQLKINAFVLQSFYGANRSILFYKILHFCASMIVDSAIIGFRKERVIFDTTYLWLETSYQHEIKSNM